MLGPPESMNAMLRPRTLLIAATAIVAAVWMAPAPAARTIDADWTGVPLREVAARLTTLGGVAIVVDRRLDPSMAITLAVSSESLDEVLEAVENQADAEVALLDGHARIAPADAAARARAGEAAREQEIRRLEPRLQRLAQGRRAWSWPEGAQPRALLAAAAAEAGIALEGLGTVPHDHFPSADMPPLPLAERLDLVLAHFDHRVEWKKRAAFAGQQPVFRIVPIAATASAAPRTAPWSPRATQAQPPPDVAHTYSLRVAAPLDDLLATLAKRFALTLELDRAALEQRGIAPREIVRLDVKDASREALLDAVLDPLGLGWRIEGKMLRVGTSAAISP
ncbi:MAG: hypothetical protein ACK6DO_05465 [Planctomycetia bacterium]